MPAKTRELARAQWREWYQRNKDTYNVATRSRKDDRKRSVTKWLDEYKKSLCCMRCGFSHPAVLQFHHRDRSTKVINVSEAPNWGWGRGRIQEEIEKCDVLCANCHFIEHYEERVGE